MQEQAYHTPNHLDRDEALSQDNLYRLIMAQEIIKALKTVADDYKATVDHHLTEGDKKEVINERGLRIGSITKTVSKKTVAPDDMSIILAEAVEQGAEIFDMLPTNPDTAEYAEAVRVLEEHAPHLLEPRITKSDMDDLIAAAEKQYQRTGSVPTGWKLATGKASYTSIRATKDAKEIARDLVDRQVNPAIMGGSVFEIEAPKGTE